ncbi:MAG: hypothetical protein R6U29_05630 [Desulfosudaceae bacterium]
MNYRKGVYKNTGGKSALDPCKPFAYQAEGRRIPARETRGSIRYTGTGIYRNFSPNFFIVFNNEQYTVNISTQSATLFFGITNSNTYKNIFVALILL